MFRLACSRERLDQDLVQLFASPLRQMKRCDVSCDHPRSQKIGMTIRDWLELEINSFCPSFCCTWRCDSLLLFWLVQSTRRFLLVLIGYLDIIGCFDSLISVWREMRTNSGLFCFSQLLRYLACFSKFSNNFDMAIFLDAPHTNFDLLQGFFSPTIYPRNYDGCLVLVLISSRGFSLVFSSFSYKSLF